MTPRRDSRRAFATLTALVIVFGLVVTMASIAVARVDEFGGASYRVPSAPYTPGPPIVMSGAGPRLGNFLEE